MMSTQDSTTRNNSSGHKLLLSCVLFSSMVIAACGNKGNELSGTVSAVPAPTSSAAASSAKSPSPEQTPIVTQTPEITAIPVTPIPTEKDAIATKIAKMSLDEKIGQMLLVGIEGTSLDESAKKMITQDKIGGIILYADNISNLQGMVKLINSLKETNKSQPSPLFISVDQEGGKVSRMPKEFASIPSNRIVGNTNDPSLAQTMGELLGRELAITGYNMDFAPVLDVNSNTKNPVIGDRSFGTSAAKVTKMGIAEINGLRSQNIIPVVKHFPGHGDTSVDSHLELPVVNKTAQQLAKLEWIPFKAAIKENVEAVMVAHILFPKLDPDMPASLSKVIIGDQLRRDMGYNGVVITDDLTMGAIVKHYSLGTAAIHTIQAGSDILLIAHGYDNEKLVFNKIKQSVKNGTISETRINESVKRILTLKNAYHLSDQKNISVTNVTNLNQDILQWRKQVQ